MVQVCKAVFCFDFTTDLGSCDQSLLDLLMVLFRGSFGLVCGGSCARAVLFALRGGSGPLSLSPCSSSMQGLRPAAQRREQFLLVTRFTVAPGHMPAWRFMLRRR